MGFGRFAGSSVCFQGIRARCIVKSDASDEKLRELVELAQGRSPVFDSVTNPVPVKRALHMLGLIGPRMRQPLAEASEATAGRLRVAMEALGLLA